jgi:hypothetical protein
MEEPVEKKTPAWQPLTPRGAAAFARAPTGRLFTMQLVVALIGAAIVVWFLNRNWYPVIRHAIDAAPEQGEIRGQTLDWTGAPSVRLAENRFLALAVDLDHSGQVRSPAHIGVEFGRQDFKVYSLFGFLNFSYPASCRVWFNRTELLPWWGAWAPAILGLAALAVIAGLLLTWMALSTLYCGPVWLIGFFANRDVSLGGSWRLAGAALMPGALLLEFALLLYGAGVLDPLRLLVACAAHFVVGWVYLILSPFAVPLLPSAVAEKGNPFTHPAA